MNNKIKIISIFIVIITIILVIFGIVGYKANSSTINNNTDSEKISESQLNKIYYENLASNMKSYLDNGGSFVGSSYSFTGNFFKYEITDGFNLNMSMNLTGSKFIDSGVLIADFYNCGKGNYLCLKYTRLDQNTYGITYINENDSDLNIIINLFETNSEPRELYTYIEKRYKEKIDNLKSNYKSQYESLISTMSNSQNLNMANVKYYEYLSKMNFYIKYDLDNIIFTISDITLDTDVIQVKILYFDEKPILYYWKTDGYWYSYDYYNKDNPVKTKIDLDYIIDIMQFTYDTGETIPLFVDIEGNLHEFNK